MNDFQKFIKAGFSANVALFITYPIDIYKINIQSFQNIKNNNMFKYYKGILPVIPLTFVEKGIKIFTYDHFRNKFDSGNFSFRAALIAGLFQGPLTNPIDIIKIRNQIRNTKIPLYRGLHLTYLRDIPFNLVFFGISDSFDNPYSKFAASFIGTTLVTPIDVIKTRYSEDTNVTIKEIVKKTKLNDYFKGIVPRVLSVGFFYGITYNLFLYL